jgi:molybdopterin-guanine dinucleotide biosynthesis protein A
MTEQNFTGIILAGGKSERIGKDKRFIPLNGNYLIDYGIQTLSTIASGIIIASGKGQFTYKGFICIQDVPQIDGPIAGLISALRYIHTPYGIVLPCDMPLITYEVLKYLVSQVTNGIDVVVPIIDGNVQPLVGLYSKHLCNEMETFARSSRYSLAEFLNTRSNRVRYIQEDELTKFGIVKNIFLNINTKSDYIRAIDIIKS